LHPFLCRIIGGACRTKHSEGQALFLTGRLHGRLPSARYPPPGKSSAGEAFVWMDRYLDTARMGRSSWSRSRATLRGRRTGRWAALDSLFGNPRATIAGFETEKNTRGFGGISRTIRWGPGWSGRRRSFLGPARTAG